jgi:hypothetical protein
LAEFNQRKLKLFDLSAHKRIFLFIITRSFKTFFAMHELCKKGYGQDVSNLLRTLLENLITALYILHDKSTADEKAARFVFYKWVILKRHLPEEEKNVRSASEKEKEDLIVRKKLIYEKVEEFKKKFHVTSDRALMTWSGKTIKDMAGQINRELVNEYETTFRLCSRFSHPSILGDNEYLIQDDKNLVFSPLPSTVGVVPNLKNAIRYTIEFMKIINELFQFSYVENIAVLESECTQVFSMEKYKEHILSNNRSQSSSSIKESQIFFKTDIL